MYIKILILSDGKYGDRATKVIQKKFINTKIITIQERNPTEVIDELDLGENVNREIEHADLLIVYVRHPDVVAEICYYKKPTILAVDFGEGFLRQQKEENPNIVMPTSMCSIPSNTGINEIDEYFNHFGYPLFEVKLTYANGEIPIITDVKAIVESPCGATNIGLEHIRGKPLTSETITAFGLNIRYECREPVSLLLSHRDMADSSALLQMISLLDALEKEVPNYFTPGTPMGIYTAKRKEEYQCPNPKSVLFAEFG
ncbi:MAG: DUF166 family protein [Candidatus Thorarchaeota archaeon]